jgi:hypothetical protein
MLKQESRYDAWEGRSNEKKYYFNDALITSQLNLNILIT